MWITIIVSKYKRIVIKSCTRCLATTLDTMQLDTRHDYQSEKLILLDHVKKGKIVTVFDTVMGKKNRNFDNAVISPQIILPQDILW